MPIHVANWLSDPIIRGLSDNERGRLVDALCRGWMGADRAVPSRSSEKVRHAFSVLWPALAEAQIEYEATHERRSKAGKIGNAMRWEASPGDRRAIAKACDRTQPKQEQEPEQEQSPSLRSGDLGTPSVSLRSTSPPAGERPAKAAPKWRRFPLESLTPEMRRFAEDRGLDADETFAEIRDHEFAVARSDPAATWRTWCRNAERYAARVPRGVPPRGQFMSASQRGTETAKRVLAETLAEELRAGRETQRPGLRRLGGVS